MRSFLYLFYLFLLYFGGLNFLSRLWRFFFFQFLLFLLYFRFFSLSIRRFRLFDCLSFFNFCYFSFFCCRITLKRFELLNFEFVLFNVAVSFHDKLFVWFLIIIHVCHFLLSISQQSFIFFDSRFKRIRGWFYHICSNSTCTFCKFQGAPCFSRVLWDLRDTEDESTKRGTREYWMKSFGVFQIFPWNISRNRSTALDWMRLLTEHINATLKIAQSNIVDRGCKTKHSILVARAWVKTSFINSFRTSHVEEPEGLNREFFITLPVPFKFN